jgi:hypothetical protein
MFMLNLPVYLYTPVIRVFLDLENSTKRGVDMMFHGYAKISKGLTNTMRFNFINGDQRPIDVSDKTFVFKMFDPHTNKEVLSKDLDVLDDGQTFNTRGQTELVVDAVLTRNIAAGHYKYSVLRVDGANLEPVYTDGASRLDGSILLDDGVTAKHVASETLTFLKNQDDLYTAGPVAANRDGRGNNNLHTFTLHFTDFTGNFKIFATLDNSSSNPNWVEVVNTDYTDQSTAIPLNITDMRNVTYFRFEYTATAGSIDKVVFRS